LAGMELAFKPNKRTHKMSSIFQSVSRTVTTTILDQDEETGLWEIELCAKIDGHEVCMEGSIERIDDEYIAMLEAWFCFTLLYEYYEKGRGHVDESRGQDFAKQSGLHGAKFCTKRRGRR
jgi:hypothetical protein